MGVTVQLYDAQAINSRAEEAHFNMPQHDVASLVVAPLPCVRDAQVAMMRP
jgi:hypothetical protein